MLVWLDRTTVAKVVEGCVYIRRCFKAILPLVGGLYHSSLRSPLLSALQYNEDKETRQTAWRSGHLGSDYEQGSG